MWNCVAKFQHIKAEIDSISLSSESMRPNVNGEAQNRAGLVAHERIDRHHLQIKDVLLQSRHCSGQHQHGTDVVDLPYVEFFIFVSRTNAEGVVGSRIDTGGLDLEDVGGNGALRGDAHVSMHNGEGQVTTP